MNLDEDYENTLEWNETLKNMKVEFYKETESLDKTQTEIKLEIKNLGCQTKWSDVSLTNKLQDIEEIISGLKKRQRKGKFNLRRW